MADECTKPLARGDLYHVLGCALNVKRSVDSDHRGVIIIAIVIEPDLAALLEGDRDSLGDDDIIADNVKAVVCVDRVLGKCRGQIKASADIESCGPAV